MLNNFFWEMPIAKTTPFEEVRGARPPRRGGAALTWYGTFLANPRARSAPHRPLPQRARGREMQKQTHSTKSRIKSETMLRSRTISNAPGEKIVGKSAHQAGKMLKVLLAPISEQDRCDAFTSRVQGVRHREPFRRDGRFAHPMVAFGCTACDQPQAFELGHLAADGGVITPPEIGQFAHPERSLALDADQQRKQRPVQGDAGFVDQRRIALWPVHHPHQVDEGMMQVTNLFTYGFSGPVSG